MKMFHLLTIGFHTKFLGGQREKISTPFFLLQVSPVGIFGRLNYIRVQELLILTLPIRYGALQFIILLR